MREVESVLSLYMWEVIHSDCWIHHVQPAEESNLISITPDSLFHKMPPLLTTPTWRSALELDNSM